MTNLATTLVLVFISIIIGFLIGALVYGLRAKPKSPAADREAQAAEQGVRLRRDPQSQSLSVEVDGKSYAQVTDLTPEGRSHLVRLARDWLIWLGVPASRLAALAAPTSQGSAEPSQPVQPAAASGSTAQPPAVLVPQKPARVAEKGKDETAPQSIAAQIDGILQARIENSTLAERGVRLQEIPGQGLVVMVGTEKYTDLTLVPDPEVREAIAAAVAEWEKKNSP